MKKLDNGNSDKHVFGFYKMLLDKLKEQTTHVQQKIETSKIYVQVKDFITKVKTGQIKEQAKGWLQEKISGTTGNGKNAALFETKPKPKRKSRRHSHRRNLHKRKSTWKLPQALGGAVLVLFIVSCGVGVYLNVTSSAVYVYVNGQKVGVAASEEKGAEMVQNVLAKRGQDIGTVAKTHDILDYEHVRIKKAELLEAKNTERELAKVLTTYVEGCALKIADETLFILPDESEAERILTAYQEYYTKPGEHNIVTSVEFVEPVTVALQEVQPEQVKLYDDALAELMHGRKVKKEYVAQKNDSWWLIARKNDMLTKEVLAGNPGMTEESIVREGMTVNLVSVVPYITVKSTGVLTATETIKRGVITKTDLNVGIGSSVVKEEGRDGSKIVKYAYRKVNDEIVGRTVLDEQIVTEPVTRVIARGPGLTAVALESAVSRGVSTGLIWPLAGSISSYYGSRYGGFHNGIDISGNTGTPYYAAADGKVVSAGWSGNYGIMILLDHGNGVMTRYAHSSKVLVSAGEQVSQGQKIGLVGSTGNSTGSHLHFEVLVNGTAVSPGKYVN